MRADSEPERTSDFGADRMVTAMRETASRLNGIVQSAMDALITVDEHQDILLFNPAAEKMFGCAAADVLGTPLDQFVPHRFRESHLHHIERFGMTGVTNRRMGGSEILALRANGQEFPVEASISQTTVGGKKLFTVILRDITERKQVESALKESAERYQRLMTLVPDAIWVERDERIGLVNQACLKLLAASSDDEILGRSPFDFIHPDDHPLGKARRERLMLGLDVDPLVQKRIVRLDGEARNVEIVEASFRDASTTVILAVLRDVTERKSAEQELHESREQLRQLSAALQRVREEEKARIARELHDELGQALTGLKMDLEEIVAVLPPEQVDAIRRTQAMRGLLDRTVRSVRRIATELRPLMLDDLGLVSTIEWLAHDFSERTGVNIALELPGHDLELEADLATALFRVLQESLTNIARHAAASRVAVKLARSDSEIRLRVEDDGNGIDPARVGTGRTFGLIGMRERAAMLGGELIVDSKPGAGTSITMIVPDKVAAPPAA